jgi:hypothetical protein
VKDNQLLGSAECADGKSRHAAKPLTVDVEAQAAGENNWIVSACVRKNAATI